MQPAFDVRSIRAAEESKMSQLAPGELMGRAAYGLAQRTSDLLISVAGGVEGARVVALVGAGNNGGDALYAGAELARRGAKVTALTVASAWHEAGAQTLRAAGGVVESAIGAAETADNPAADSSVVSDVHAELLRRADVVLDGILGIGGSGALREPAATLAAHAAASAAKVVAVDLPSGVDADTGAVADAQRCVWADLTVTFGELKPGLLVAPGADHVGELDLVDIGLSPFLSAVDPVVTRVQRDDAAALVPLPGRDDDKYTRGVVGVIAGSADYPGAGVLCTGAARLGGCGLVRYAGGAPGQVISHWPEVVISRNAPADAGRVQVWVVGPGGGTDDAAAARLAEALAIDVTVLVDADGLTLIAKDDALRAQIKDRHDNGLTTILTPHAGEFARLGFTLPTAGQADRVSTVAQAARELGAVLLLKGHCTVVAAPTGAVFVNTLADSALATAGSGDVLSGLIGSLVGSHVARVAHLDSAQIAEVVACAALIHGLAGKIAAADLAPVTSLDVLASVSTAIAALRADSGYAND